MKHDKDLAIYWWGKSNKSSIPAELTWIFDFGLVLSFKLIFLKEMCLKTPYLNGFMK